MLGVTIAGVASCLLVTTYGLFYVDVFLRVYELPLETYSYGNVIFAVVNTANDFMGAWLLDSIASRSIHRSDLIGLSGCLFAVAFLTPFFRWKTPMPQWDGLHFILSMSLYDTLYSFTTILLGSLVTDNHQMTDEERVWFMASGKTANLIASFLVGRIGLYFFQEENLTPFRAFLWVLAVLVAGLFSAGQLLTRFDVNWKTMQVRPAKKMELLPSEGDGNGKRKGTRQLALRRVFRDFWNHKNFWAWIGMEFLLEAQVTFISSFLKMFVDRLIFDTGVSRELCDWLLSFIRPFGLIAGIFCYIPIRRYGYKKLYEILFATNACLALAMLLFANHQSTYAILFFIVVYPTITVAVSSSGFHLVMSDMVLEMKGTHTKNGRLDEPSLAALYMGMNALFCKPAESFLPVIAANRLSHHVEGSEENQKALFAILIFPPMIFSVLEWLSWRRYTLTPQKTKQIRDDLHELHRAKSHDQDDWF